MHIIDETPVLEDMRKACEQFRTLTIRLANNPEPLVKQEVDLAERKVKRSTKSFRRLQINETKSSTVRKMFRRK